MGIFRFWQDMVHRVGLKRTDKIMVGNVDSNDADYIDVSEILTPLTTDDLAEGLTNKYEVANKITFDPTNNVNAGTMKATVDSFDSLLSKDIANGLLATDTIPQKEDALIWLNGEIKEVSGSYYFVDQINGWDFLINNYDFNQLWVMSFPYKSNATISAPIGNATLIAADINNYLYDNIGTPNEIPVISLFQNIDYDNKLFCRHIGQQLNGVTGEETGEPVVKDMVLYKTPRTDIQLSICSQYYDVPTEATADVIWVDAVNGIDTNAGTKVAPFKSLVKASTGTANKTIYVKSGTYAETAAIYLLAGQKWIGTGLCINTNSNAISWRTNGSNNSEINGMIITPAVGGRGYYYISGNNNIINRCKIIANGSFSQNIQIIAGTGNAVKNSILCNSQDTPHINLQSVALDIIGCHFSGTQTGVADTISFKTTAIVGAQNIHYNKFVNTLADNHVLFAYQIAGDYSIKYNDILTIGGSFIQSLLAGATMTGSINYEYNYIKPTSLTLGVFLSADRSNVINYTFNTNKIIIADTNIISNGIISLLEQPSPIVINNYIDNYTPKVNITINSKTPKGVANISYNTILSRADSGSIVLGSDLDNSYDDTYNGSIVHGNKMYGIWYFNPFSTVNLNHGIAIFNLSACSVKYNYGNGTNHLVVIKASDRAVPMVATDVVVAYNYGVENDMALFAKTMSGVKFYNNTTYASNPNITAVSGGVNILGSTGVPQNTDIKNNIFIDETPAKATVSLIRIQTDVGLTGLLSDYNILYSKNNTIVAVKNIDNDYTFAQWQSLGYDINSISPTEYQISALFNDFINKNFSLRKDASLAIGAGENLTNSNEDGLDASTEWGDDETLPKIVTKKQTVPWDIGAYVN